MLEYSLYKHVYKFNHDAIDKKSIVDFFEKRNLVKSQLNSPNHDACSFVKAIGSDLLVRLWNVIAGNPKPIPDDKIEKLASTLIESFKRKSQL